MESSASVQTKRKRVRGREDPSRLYPGPVAQRWIRFIHKDLRWTHIGASIGLFALTNLAFLLFGVAEHTSKWVDLLRELFVIMGAVIVPLLGTMAALTRPLGPVIHIIGESGPGASVILAFFGDSVSRMATTLVDLRADGALLEPWEVAGWVRRCFSVATGQYVGTDSHLPSLYERLYTDYLSAHEEYLTTTGREDSVRIMLVEVEQLRTDRYNNPVEFNTFMQWHTGRRQGEARKPVALLRLSSYLDEKLVADRRWNPKLRNVDIGFWRDDFALLFSRTDPSDSSVPKQVRVVLALKGERLYDECEDYVEALLDMTNFERNNQRDLTEELPIYSDELSEHWRLFCDPSERLAQTEPFLKEVLARFGEVPKDIRVFDAAAGIGIETTALLKAGYFVIANEIEPALRAAARQYAHDAGTQIPEALFTRLDWLTISQNMMPDGFHAVYVIGNSLCHLDSLDQIYRAVKNFYDILVPGGVLICDERNFAYILDEWTNLQGDPWNDFRFNHREQKVMYHGTRVMGAPVRRRNDRIVFDYAEVHHDGKTIVPEKIVGELSMLALRKGDLKERLEMVGFRDIEVYGDLAHAEANGIPSDADFITYVATKKA